MGWSDVSDRLLRKLFASACEDRPSPSARERVWRRLEHALEREDPTADSPPNPFRLAGRAPEDSSLFSLAALQRAGARELPAEEEEVEELTEADLVVLLEVSAPLATASVPAPQSPPLVPIQTARREPGPRSLLALVALVAAFSVATVVATWSVYSRPAHHGSAPRGR